MCSKLGREKRLDAKRLSQLGRVLKNLATPVAHLPVILLQTSVVPSPSSV
jgi:hypothetical protein